MEGDPAVTLKQQVEAIIRTGTGGWMSPHALISLGPSGPLQRVRANVFVSPLKVPKHSRITSELVPTSPLIFPPWNLSSSLGFAW